MCPTFLLSKDTSTISRIKFYKEWCKAKRVIFLAEDATKIIPKLHLFLKINSFIGFATVLDEKEMPDQTIIKPESLRWGSV